MADENDASDKTEDPTQKRLDDALERGDVAKSQEINTWFVIAGGTLVMSTFSSSIGGGMLQPLRNLLANAWMIRTDGPGLLSLASSLEYAVIAAEQRDLTDEQELMMSLEECKAPPGMQSKLAEGTAAATLF